MGNPPFFMLPSGQTPELRIPCLPNIKITGGQFRHRHHSRQTEPPANLFLRLTAAGFTCLRMEPQIRLVPLIYPIQRRMEPDGVLLKAWVIRLIYLRTNIIPVLFRVPPFISQPAAVKLRAANIKTGHTSPKADGSWTNPKNLGNKINTPNDETAGDITPDGKYMTGNNTLTWYVTSRLPEGLNFDPDARKLSGTPSEAGTFKVTVLAIDSSEASASTTFSLKTNAASGVDNQDLDQNFRLFPNPVKEKLHLSFGTEAYQNTNIIISNLSGEIVVSSSMHRGSTETIDLTGKAPGINFLLLNIDGEIINRKFCLE